MFITGRLPIKDDQERDIIRRIWSCVDESFDASDLQLRRYELGVTEVGKVERDSTKALNDSSKISNIMKSMLLNLSKHCPMKQLAIEGMIMSGLKINFFQLANLNGYVCVMNRKNEYFYPVHAKKFTKKMIPLLKQIWINKLTMESLLDVVLTAEPDSSQLIIPPCFQKL